MSFIKKYCLIIFGSILLPANISAEFDVDYFYGQESMRSQEGFSCEDHQLSNECTQQCGANNYACLNGDCICLEQKISQGKPQRDSILPPSKQTQMILGDLVDLIEGLNSYLSDVEQMEERKKGERPALRHHIAHFCPNLDIARECIYTCMKVGKPAFCGKDHKCYCGHKYSEHDKNPEININDMHLQFRDLYTKYFGPEDGKSIETIENK